MKLVRAALIQFAHQLDSERAAEIERDFGQSAGSAVAIVLATAFAQFYPRSDWQREGLAQLEREGWRAPHTRGEILKQITSRFRDGGDRASTLSAMRQGAWVERARIAIRELLPHTQGGAPLVVTMREISWLAESLLEVACSEARAHATGRFGVPRTVAGSPSLFFVLGMGKLGGLELNAGSDIDLCFLYDTDDGGNETSLHEHWSLVGQRVAQNIELPTDDGSAWRVDLRLRPEGSRGAISNSFAASERYYETWGRLWERSALVRARPVAGDLELGTRFLSEVVSPFVYRREVDPSIANSLAELLTRTRIELRVDTDRDLKLGVGGIREAEFFVQALQLIWGGRERSLRVPGFFSALERLLGAGLVTEREVSLLVEAYTLLRTVEHRIQWCSAIQTHSLPKEAQSVELIARTLGLENGESLLGELERARTVVFEAFSGLSEGKPWPQSRHVALFALIDRASSPLNVDALPSGESVPSESIEAEIPAELLEQYLFLAKRPDGILGGLTRERYPRFTELLLDAVANSPQPERAAWGLRLVFGRINHPFAYFAALAEDERAIRRLVTALASSQFIVDTLTNNPDSLDIVMSVGGMVESPRDLLARELRSAAACKYADHYEQLNAVVAVLRRVKSRLFVEVVIADLSGAIELRQARQTLSELADASLNHAACQVFDGAVRGLGIVALGKLGAQDLGYGSDLDVVFLYDPSYAPDPTEAQAYFIRRAQQIIRLVSVAHPAGPGYELDVRLRPSGSKGMLVTSLEAFALYHNLQPGAANGLRPSVVSSGAPWERQVLLRARACAGDMEVAGRAVELANIAAYEKGPPDVCEMHRLRMRMQQELGAERGGHFDLKTGNGGLLDIEFATQWLQMVHGRDPRIHTTNTEDALLMLHEAGYLANAHYHAFQDGYVFLRRLEQNLFVINGRGSSAFDIQSAYWPRLAHRMRLQDSRRAPAAELLRTRYTDVTEAVRESYLAVLGVV